MLYYALRAPEMPTRLGHDEIVTALLIAKADEKIRNDEGKTALMLAAEGGHDETVRVLTQAGAGT